MQQEINYTISADIQVSIKARPSRPLLEEHSAVLEKFGLEYKSSECYYEIGEPGWIEGWIIDISVIPIQFENVLETVIPILIEEKIAFKVAKNAGIARSIMSGDLGYLLLGKFMSIYPADGQRALDIVTKLIAATRIFKGPEILTDRRLANVIYVRYGACKGVTLINDNGTEEKHIYNLQGTLIKDPFSIPFMLPDGIEWPFSSIAPVKSPKKNGVLQEKYRPMYVLKEDAKGSVRKGLYLEKVWLIKWCIIKEGKKYMLGDSMGRDMSDRLRWQYELHKELEGVVPLPTVYDLFEENENIYLVMEFIKGEPLHHIVGSILKGRIWQQIDIHSKTRILKICIGILDIISRMHEKGYIHRDITPANFLFDSRRNLCMIDLELAYCEYKKKPRPAFRLGTPGFISPEQEETLTPTVEQDIYSIGALFIFLFTGLMPDKFAQKDLDCLKDQLNFFILDDDMTDLLGACLEKNPQKRPHIASLKARVEGFQKKQIHIEMKDPIEAVPKHFSIDKDKLKLTIQNGLKGLGHHTFLNEGRIWVSHSVQEDGFEYDHNEGLSVYTEFYQGLSGIIWLLSRAHQLQFSIDYCRNKFERSLRFIRDKKYFESPKIPAGLYFGTAGLALSIIEGITGGLIPNDDNIHQELGGYLKNINTCGIGMAKGLSGQGMALLRYLSLIDDASIHDLLQSKIRLLVDLQEKDGSWKTIITKKNKPAKSTGFGHGVAGVACFLMSYLKQYEGDSTIRQTVIKALDWLAKQAHKQKGRMVWPLDESTKLFSFDFQEGGAGIALAMIKAYELFREQRYRNLAEDCLRGYEAFPVSTDITQATGLAGFGEVYLEAERVFRTGEWQNRTNWINEFFLHHFRKENDGSIYWMPNGTRFTTAGLMEGNSGIIHFLLRYYEPDRLSHPLLI